MPVITKYLYIKTYLRSLTNIMAAVCVDLEITHKPQPEEEEEFWDIMPHSAHPRRQDSL
jgi:hypothetical protein